jgi:predicted 3-demethylubiquinone-9 3-methyltransferase (glyoxalase superfamily)
VDYYWEKLSAGGHQDQCGWLTDKFGVSWQIVPTVLVELLEEPDPVKSQAGDGGNAQDEQARYSTVATYACAIAIHISHG